MAESQVARNRVISVTYTILDEAREILEKIDVPVSYLHGRETGLFEKIERALEGKTVGDEVQVELAPAEHFGEWDPDLSFSDAIENVPPQYRQLGAEAEFVNDEGGSMKMVVTHVDSGTVTLDGNHPFAGKHLTFIVKVVDVREATPEERARGEVAESRPTLH